MARIASALFLFVFSIIIAVGLAQAETIPEALERLAVEAAADVEPGDRNAALNAAARYPEGGEFLIFHRTDDGVEVEIPSRAAAYFMMGVQAVTIDRNRAVARWCFLEAARRNPTQPAFLNNAAFLLIEYDMLEEAKRILIYDVEREPDHIDAIINLGEVHELQGEHEKAAQRFLQAFKKRPQDPDPIRRARKSASKADPASPIVREVMQMSDIVLPDEDKEDTAADADPFSPGTCTAFGYIKRKCNRPKGQADVSDRYYDEPSEERGNIFSDYVERLDGVKEDYWNEHKRIEDARIRNESKARQAGNDCYTQCGRTTHCHVYCNNCVTDIKKADGDVKAGRETLQAARTRSGRTKSEVQRMQNLLKGVYQAHAPNFPPGWRAYMACVFDNQVQQSYCEDYTGGQASAKAWEATITRNLNVTEQRRVREYADCEKTARPVAWLLSEQTTIGISFNFCILVACVSIDESGNMTFSVKAIVAVEFSVNPLKDDWSVNMGVGLEVGIGSESVEGSLMLTSVEGDISIDATFEAGAGPLSVSHTMSIRRGPGP